MGLTLGNKIGIPRASGLKQSWSSYWKTLYDHFDEDLVIPYGIAGSNVAADTGKYEAWPQIAKDSSGKLYVVYRTCDTNTHLFDATGKVVMKISSDNGATWGSEITVVDTALLDDRNAAILIFDDDGTESILVTYNTYSAASATEFLCIKATVADPNTWGTPVSISQAIGSGYGRGLPIMLSNGKILAPFNHTVSGNHCMVGESSDGGDTWTNYEITSTYRQEIAIIECKTGGSYSGKVYAMIRNSDSPYGYYESISLDYGRTWSTIALNSTVVTDKATPIEFLRYDTNTILGFSSRNSGGTVWKSTDECSTWEFIGYWGGFYVYSGAGACSYYPSAVKISDGTIGIVWCDNGTVSDVFFNSVSYPALKAPATAKWKAHNTGTYTVADSQLKMTSDRLVIMSLATFEYPFTLEARIKHTNAAYIGIVLGSRFDQLYPYDSSNNIGLVSNSNISVCEKSNDAYYGDAATEGEFKTYTFEVTETNVKIYEEGTLLLEKNVTDGSGVPQLTPGGVMFYISAAGQSVYVDYIGVREI